MVGLLLSMISRVLYIAIAGTEEHSWVILFQHGTDLGLCH